MGILGQTSIVQMSKAALNFKVNSIKLISKTVHKETRNFLKTRDHANLVHSKVCYS